jgi:shikimate kinase
MRARAIVNGAVSVVNAIPAGKGAALGIGLRVGAEVALDRSGEVRVEGEARAIDGGRLARAVAQRALERFGASGLGAAIAVSSKIPPSRGLKSSSAVAVAVALATLAALGAEASEEELLRLVATACKEAGVSITGAMDDAAACLLGGLVAADCEKMKLVARHELPPGLMALIMVPERTRPKVLVPIDRLRKFSRQCEQAFRLTLEGFWQPAMVLNGIVCSAALGEPLLPALEALEHGALAAGLSGTGPAIAAVCEAEAMARLKEVWSAYRLPLLEAPLSNERAEVRRLR